MFYTRFMIETKQEDGEMIRGKEIKDFSKIENRYATRSGAKHYNPGKAIVLCKARSVFHGSEVFFNFYATADDLTAASGN